MDQIWMDLYNAAKAVQNDRVLSEQIRAGCVAAAVEIKLRENLCWRLCRYSVFPWYLCRKKRHIQHDNQWGK